MQVELELSKLKYLKTQIIESPPGKNIREHRASYGQLAFKAMQQNGSLWPTMKVCKYLKNKNQPKVTSFSAKLQAGRESKLMSGLSTLYGQQVNLARVLLCTVVKSEPDQCIDDTE